MLSLGDTPVVCFDVDDTLIMWNIPVDAKDEDLITVEDEHIRQKVLPHKEHIEQIRKHKVRGHKIVVWSAGGGGWAEAAVKALGIEDLVDVCMSKPEWLYDDLHYNQWMPDKVQYLEREKYLGTK